MRAITFSSNFLFQKHYQNNSVLELNKQTDCLKIGI